MFALKEGWDIAQQDEGARDLKPGTGIISEGFGNGQPSLLRIDPIII